MYIKSRLSTFHFLQFNTRDVVSILESFLNFGMNVDSKNAEGRTALGAAAQRGMLQATQLSAIAGPS